MKEARNETPTGRFETARNRLASLREVQLAASEELAEVCAIRAGVHASYGPCHPDFWQAAKALHAEALALDWQGFVAGQLADEIASRLPRN